MKHRAVSYPHRIAFGFLLLILIGACLLCLPIAAKSGESTPFLTSLFTATSATCVTGLVLVDTYVHWSLFGQLVILVLIQIGGLGFMTLMTAFSLALHRTISLRERTLLKENFNLPEIGGMVRLTKRIVSGTVLFEGIGSIVLTACLIPKFGISRGIYTGVFLSISAFCNAGFDLLGSEGAFSSLMSMGDNPVFLITIAVLITIGGIGFVVWDDVIKHRHHVRKYRLHSKIALTVTAILMVFGTLLFFLLERNATGAGLSIPMQVLHAFFDAVTPRTAGFNAVDVAALSPASKLLSVVFMLVGGSPGSTAGGIKTVTVTVLIICMFSNLRRRSGYNVFGRRLPQEVLVNALSVVGIYLTLLTTGVFVISIVQPELSFMDVVFECTSAVGTVGMTTGITRTLTVIPRCMMILLMFSGRIGSLSFAMMFMQNKKQEIALLPEETVGVG